ncbi:MAG: type II secretion system protein GspG, partial [Candidatus Omnitrophica bacterium]|nr:type II secretion system protein GspG [Candidatus Omnitrophota bacterium]
MKKSFTPLEKNYTAKRPRSLTGFTLIELIVVIAIIAILAAIIAPNAFRAIEKAKITRAAADFRVLKNAAYTLYADTGKWPLYKGLYSPSGRDVYLTNPRLVLYSDTFNWQGWDGPYLDKTYDKSPWGGPMAFECSTLGHGPDMDLWLEYYGGTWTTPTRVPNQAAKMLDELYD